MAKLVLGPGREKMLAVGLPSVLDDMNEDGTMTGSPQELL